MPAALEPRTRPHPAAEQRVILYNLSWKTFEGLLQDPANSRRCRLAYDRGTLEIMSPLIHHEGINRTLATMIIVLAEELGIEVRSAGSLTCKREDLDKGLEPDSSFYIQNETLVRGKKEIDLAKDPPPDLIIEVDISRGSLNKFPIYAALGVPEVWRFDGRKLSFHRLKKGQFESCKQSLAFPRLP